MTTALRKHQIPFKHLFSTFGSSDRHLPKYSIREFLSKEVCQTFVKEIPRRLFASLPFFFSSFDLVLLLFVIITANITPLHYNL